MIAPNIELSPRSDSKLRIRAFFDTHSREPRGTRELYWQRQLTELDSELHLRWNYAAHKYIVLYDHHELVTVAWSFGPDESFGLAYKNLRHKSSLNARKLREMLKAQREGEQQAITDKIAEGGAQAGSDLHMMAKRKTTTDSVDDFKQVAVGEKGHTGIRIY